MKNNKQEQIEEMISAMAASNNPFVDVPVEIMPNVAEAIYNAGYRKLPKDSVVLSMEEYEMLVNQYKNLEIKYSNLCDNYRLCKDANETLKQNIIVTRKETAEKILNDLVKNCQYTFSIDGKPIVELDGDFVLNAAKSYGIKIKEYL